MIEKKSSFRARVLEKILTMSNRKFALLFLIFIILKNGIHPIGTEWIDWVYAAGKSFPNPENYLSFSIIPVLIAKVMNFPNYLIWWTFFACLTVLFYILLTIYLEKIAGKNFKKILLITFSFPILISPLYYLGHYDLITISGGLLSGLTNSKKLIIFGAILAVGANPEQALMTSICMFFVALGTRSKLHKYIAWVWITLSSISYFILKLVIGNSDNGNRIDITIGLLKDIILNSAGRLNLIIFSVFGLGWVFIYFIFRFEKSFYNKSLVLLGTVLLPVSLSIAILDRTRIGVAVGCLPLVLAIKYLVSSEIFNIFERIRLEHLMIAFVLMPTIFIDTDGSLRLPYYELINKFLV